VNAAPVLRVGPLLDRAISLVIRNWRGVLPLAAFWTIVKLALRDIFPHSQIARDDFFDALLDLVMIPAYLALFAGRASGAVAAVRWAAPRTRSVVLCALIYWTFTGAPNDIVDEAGKHAFGIGAHTLPLVFVTGILFAPLELATNLLYPEVLLANTSFRAAIGIVWRRAIRLNLRRSWFYGAVLQTIFFLGSSSRVRSAKARTICCTPGYS